MISIRDSFGLALVEAGSKYENVVAVSCDLKSATRLKGFFEKFPNRSFEVGISEANGIGISAGLALSGFRPFISSFGSFITGKNVEIRTSIAYNEAPVVVIGTHGGLIGPDGTTQAGLQDISVMRSIPKFQVFQPASPIETNSMIHYSASSKDMIYIRIARNEVPEIYDKSYQFEPGKGSILNEGNQITLISSGPCIHACLDAARKLRDIISIRVLNIPSIKPIDKDLLLKCANETLGIMVVEDHSIEGGLGSVVSEVISTYGIGIRIHKHGINNSFIVSGKPNELENLYKLDSPGIIEEIKKFWMKIESD